MRSESVAVVVVGDLARSPRMVNHARELARTGVPVTLVGCRERDFAAPDGVAVRPLLSWRTLRALGLPGAALRMALTLCQLLAALLLLRPAAILVQNPPAFPTLLAGWIATRLLRAQLVVDWHNYGYSMLALWLGADHAITRWAERYEAWVSRHASRHFCVSAAMQADLERRFGVRAEVLYDRPIQCFSRSSDPAPHRPVAVCSAGWTADEDMELLFDSLDLLHPHNLEIHVTGDGPMRARMAPRIAGLIGSGLDIHAGYLGEREYWALIRRADFGISLHRSSSGLDLAMKVVDFFSSGAPVCALDYGGSLPEQICDGETGFLFRSAVELAAILDRLQQKPALLDPMRESVRARCVTTWTDEWNRVAAPVFRRPQ